MPGRPLAAALLASTLALPLAATAAAAAPRSAPPRVATLRTAPPPAGVAILRNADGQQVGRATFDPEKGGVKVQLEVAGLKPGLHGIHLHAVGKCDGPDFQTAGGHFDPAGKHHGLRARGGAHAGDLPNLRVGPDGKAKATFTARGVTLDESLRSLLGPDGASIVIHEGRDDQRSDPAGNSGARVVCGVVERR
jgi:Cu-Zn family superoxide dismutase